MLYTKNAILDIIEKARLTGAELQTMWEKWSYERFMLNKEGKMPDEAFGDLIAQAQLGKIKGEFEKC